MTATVNPVTRILRLVKLERKEISAIYFYAILNGLILLAIPVGIQALVSFAQTNTASTSVVLLIVLVVLSVFIAGVLQINQMKIIEKIQQRIFVRYSFGFAEKIPAIKLTAVDNYYLPELMNRFFDTLTLQKKLAKILLDFPLAIIQILFGLLLLAFYHPVFIAFGLLLVLVVWGILYFSGMKGLQASLEESTYKYKVVSWLQEMARVIRSVKFAGANDFPSQKTDEQVTNYLQARTRHFKILLIQFKTLIGFKVLVTTAMLVVGTWLLLNQQLNVGQFIAAEIVILTILNSVEKIIVNLDSVYDVLTAVEKIEQVVDKQTEATGTVMLQDDGKGINIQFINTGFGYPGKNEILGGVSFTASANEKICIQGDEGTGKSTLLRLLAGLYDNFDGAILINDIPLNNYNLQSLRRRTGLMISQQDIFEGTLLENIVMGSDTVDMKEVMNLCSKVGLTAFVATLKNGFDTPLFTSGRKLPGSVVKKILLVRALVHKPSLLLLEEPWSGLEEQYQQSIRQLLLAETANTTLFIITKDKTFSSACDKVIVLKRQGCEVIVPKK